MGDVGMGGDDFEGCVGEAVGAIPEPCASALDEVGVVVEERAPRGMHPRYGLYVGVPLGAGGLPSGVLPARIAIYMHPMIDHYPVRAEVVEQVRVTVLHELGHHLGFDEDQLEDLGYA